MPSKNPITYEARKEFIESKIDELLKDKTNNIYSVAEAKLFISERYIFCEPRSIDRMLLDYQPTPKQEKLDFQPSNQLQLFNNL